MLQRQWEELQRQIRAQNQADAASAQAESGESGGEVTPAPTSDAHVRSSDAS